MPSGSSAGLADLPEAVADLLVASRRGVLATTASDGSPRAVPVCFAIVNGEVVTAVDQKPKSTRRPARLVNAQRAGTATLLFDRWDEDWTRLGWVMVTGRARIEPPGWGRDELIARYPQYGTDPPLGESLVVMPSSVRWWTWE